MFCVIVVITPSPFRKYSNCSNLNLGAGGALSYAAVKAYPNMKSTIFDLPAVVNVADHFRPSVEECPRRDNVAFVAGDFFEDELPPADIYSLVTILHDWDEERIDVLLRKIYNSLPSGKLHFKKPRMLSFVRVSQHLY